VFPDHVPRLVKDGDYTELREALLSVGKSRSGDNIDSGKLGGWLGDRKDVTIGDLTLRKDVGHPRRGGTSNMSTDHRSKPTLMFKIGDSLRIRPCPGLLHVEERGGRLRIWL
jgi:hypothetical protein